MNLDWSRRVRIEDQNVILHARNHVRAPRVTIGLPTFNRPHTIRRALSSLARQTYRDFVVIVSDNAGVCQSTIDAVRSVEDDLPEVYLLAQNPNAGALPNMNLALACASTEYFMWLADDDEISANYLERLVSLLDGDPEAVSAMSAWRRMHNEHEGEDRTLLDKSTRNRALRIFRYIAFESGDSLFYGLHRAERLRQCQFQDYFYPNKGVLTNWCYVFLFDMVWQGPVRHASDAAWISHNYSEKSYVRSLPTGFGNKAKTLLRRVNMYYLFCAKTADKSPPMLLLAIPASLLGFARDVISALARVAHRRVGQARAA